MSDHDPNLNFVHTMRDLEDATEELDILTAVVNKLKAGKSKARRDSDDKRAEHISALLDRGIAARRMASVRVVDLRTRVILEAHQADQETGSPAIPYIEMHGKVRDEIHKGRMQRLEIMTANKGLKGSPKGALTNADGLRTDTE
ncbi:MAG: hypothetical protein WCY71_00020 [Halothiobacillaceae bacterium]